MSDYRKTTLMVGELTQLIAIVKSIYTKLLNLIIQVVIILQLRAVVNADLLHMSLLATTIGSTVSIHIPKLQSCRLWPIS